MIGEHTVELEWPECPHCQDEPEDLKAVSGRGFEWTHTCCGNCGQGYELRMNRRALFEVRV